MSKYIFSDKWGVEWIDELPAKCNPEVINATLNMAARVAMNGVGEKVAAKGFLLVLGDEGRLLEADIGSLPPLNKYRSEKVFVKDTKNEIYQRFVFPDFITDGAMAINWETGQILAMGLKITQNLERGSDQGGAKHKAASAAALAGFFVIKCSEDSCGVDGVPKGHLHVFPPGNKEAVLVESMPPVSVLDENRFLREQVRVLNETLHRFKSNETFRTDSTLSCEPSADGKRGFDNVSEFLDKDTQTQTFSEGQAVAIWSNTRKTWVEGKIERVFLTDECEGNFSVPAGALKVAFTGSHAHIRSYKYISREQVKDNIRQIEEALASRMLSNCEPEPEEEVMSPRSTPNNAGALRLGVRVRVDHTKVEDFNGQWGVVESAPLDHTPRWSVKLDDGRVFRFRPECLTMNAKTCPRGHLLQELACFTALPNKCIGCHLKEIKPPDRVFRCNDCNFALCQACYGSSDQESIDAMDRPAG